MTVDHYSMANLGSNLFSESLSAAVMNVVVNVSVVDAPPNEVTYVILTSVRKYYFRKCHDSVYCSSDFY